MFFDATASSAVSHVLVRTLPLSVYSNASSALSTFSQGYRITSLHKLHTRFYRILFGYFLSDFDCINLVTTAD